MYCWVGGLSAYSRPLVPEDVTIKLSPCAQLREELRVSQIPTTRVLISTSIENLALFRITQGKGEVDCGRQYEYPNGRNCIVCS